MIASDLLEKISGALNSAANVKSVFGEPIEAQGRTVVPVAKVAYGFGGGAGGGYGKPGSELSRHGEGGGGGGGVRAWPAGALEITAAGTRFIPYFDAKTLSLAFVAGLVAGRFFLRRRH
jgi:uncharacterized spore protein YtfJ